MEIAAHIDILAEQGRLLAQAAAAAGPGAPVPTCPGWVVRDLVRHQGGVHRWATGIVAGQRTEPWAADLDEVVGAWPSDTDLTDWFTAGCASLVQALSQADPGLDCWAFLAAPSPLAMWARRQAHETSVHRADAEIAAGQPVTPAQAPFAADGIDELLACFITRPGSTLRSDPLKRLGARCADTPGEWLVSIGPDSVTTTSGEGVSAAADCVLTGAADDLYLGLWHRKPAAAVSASGDAAVLALFDDKVKVRWR